MAMIEMWAINAARRAPLPHDFAGLSKEQADARASAIASRMTETGNVKYREKWRTAYLYHIANIAGF